MVKKILCGTAVLLCAGCTLLDLRIEPTVYELPQAQIKSAPRGIRVGAIRNLSGAGRQLLLHGEHGVMTLDADAKWLVSPEVALERSLRGVFLDDGKSDRVLDVILQRFEFQTNNGRKYAVLGIIYQLRQSRNWTEFSGEFSAEVHGGDYGEAMNRCVEASINNLLARKELK